MALTEDQWYAHPDFRKELQELLNHPTLKIAIEIALEKGARATLVLPNVDIVQYFAIMGAKKDGYREGFLNLQSLTQPKPAPVPERKPWKSTPADSDRTSAP